MAMVVLIAGSPASAATGDIQPPTHLNGVIQNGLPSGHYVESNGGSTFEVVPAPGARSQYLKIACKGQVNDPHYSDTSAGQDGSTGGAIFKTVITCTGTGAATVDVRVKGGLFLDYAESPTSNNGVTWIKRAESSQIQTIAVNGKSKTFYTPLKGGNGGYGRGFWSATATWQIVSPGEGNVGSSTNVVFKGIIP